MQRDRIEIEAIRPGQNTVVEEDAGEKSGIAQRLDHLATLRDQLNPKENLWDEIREKIFKNYALKSIDAVHQKLEEAILYIERNPKMVKSITSFPYIAKSF